jgi:hypothetical protein
MSNLRYHILWAIVTFSSVAALCVTWRSARQAAWEFKTIAEGPTFIQTAHNRATGLTHVLHVSNTDRSHLVWDPSKRAGYDVVWQQKP